MRGGTGGCGVLREWYGLLRQLRAHPVEARADGVEQAHLIPPRHGVEREHGVECAYLEGS